MCLPPCVRTAVLEDIILFNLLEESKKYFQFEFFYTILERRFENVLQSCFRISTRRNN